LHDAFFKDLETGFHMKHLWKRFLKRRASLEIFEVYTQKGLKYSLFLQDILKPGQGFQNTERARSFEWAKLSKVSFSLRAVFIPKQGFILASLSFEPFDKTR
jgi:hypothetical protein